MVAWFEQRGLADGRGAARVVTNVLLGAPQRPLEASSARRVAPPPVLRPDVDGDEVDAGDVAVDLIEAVVHIFPEGSHAL